jgi:hypothetical protein
MSSIMLLNGIAINLVNLWPLQLLFLFHIMMCKIDYRNQVKERCNWKQRRKETAILGTLVRSLLSFSRQSSSALVMLQTQYSAMSFSSSIFVSMQIHIGLPCWCNQRTHTHHPTTTYFFEDESSYAHIFAWGCSSVFSSKGGYDDIVLFGCLYSMRQELYLLWGDSLKCESRFIFRLFILH